MGYKDDILDIISNLYVQGAKFCSKKRQIWREIFFKVEFCGVWLVCFSKSAGDLWSKKISSIGKTKIIAFFVNKKYFQKFPIFGKKQFFDIWYFCFDVFNFFIFIFFFGIMQF